MEAINFVKVLINATKHGKLEWNPVPRKYFDLITNISDGIIDAFYADYKEDTMVVIYQYKSFDDYNLTEDINHYISIVDDHFRYKYEIAPSEYMDARGDIFALYKDIQKSAYKIDDFFQKFINDFK